MRTGTNVAETILVAGIFILSIELLMGTEARGEKEQACAEAACLSWEAPNKWENGAELPGRELASFNIYVYAGEAEPDCQTIRKKSKVVISVSPDRREYTVPLPGGTFFFAVTAVDNNKRESICSNIKGKKI